MKTQTSFRWLSTLTLATALVLAARTVPAQDSGTTTTATASTGQPAPLLSYGVNQIIQLSKAKVGDETIINFIRNSGSSYGLDAGQIIYLKQQGVSDTVINTMMNQPRASQPTAAVPASATATSTATATVNIATQPTVTSVQVDPIYVPSSSVYVIPDTQTFNYYAYSYRPYSPYYSGYYYPYYRPAYYYGGYRPAVVFSFGGGYGGGHYRGGWHR
ncbi:MAG TPA: hypothetical protein VMB80_13335 [Candidatus Acidoferrum sp.]|nr:hypothetical protein [Candidatus Acidoferrum sp.]